MDDFDLFWSHYPKKKNKGDARKAWKQTEAIRPPTPVIIEAVERGKASVDWHKADSNGVVGAFIPYPASFIRGERWEDEYTVRLSSIKTPAITCRSKCSGARSPATLRMAAPSSSLRARAARCGCA